MAFRSIDAENVIKTIDRLHRRIEERFPKRGLVAVCLELADVARKDRDRVRRLARPYIGVRIAVFLLALLLIASLGYLAKDVKGPSLLRAFRSDDASAAMFNLFQGVDSAVNVIVFFGVGLFFLLRHEERAKRAIALEDLHELRSLAHVIDMHQLTKDPTTLLSGNRRTTASSPHEIMTPFELSRYLDYCSEMLSLVAKVAACYAQDVRDPVVIEAVNDIELLTTNLSGKIWQKIIILEQTPDIG
jgi:hypothetical protein